MAIRNCLVAIVVAPFWTALVFAQPPTPQAEAKSTAKSANEGAAPREYTAFHTYEIHQAKLLQAMMKEQQLVSGAREKAVDRIIAEFVRATMEDKPRPVLIAYKAEPLVSPEGHVFEPSGDTVQEFADGKIDPSRALLVDLIADQLDPTNAGKFNTVVKRWSIIRPPPLDHPLRRLGRALIDPGIFFLPGEREKATDVMMEAFDALPKEEQRRAQSEKHEPEIRKKVLATLPTQTAAKLEQTIAWMEADYKIWTEPGYAHRMYEEAVKLLEAEKKAEAAASQDPTKPDDTAKQPG